MASRTRLGVSCRAARILGVALALPWLASTAPPARAQGDLPIRPVEVRFDGDILHLGYAPGDFVDAEVEKKLQSGLPQTLVTRVVAHAEGETRARAATAVSCRVVHDLWGGRYEVQRQIGGEEESLHAENVASAVSLCLPAELLLSSSAQLAELRGKEIFITVSVELNPVSPEGVKRIQRWLAKTEGGDLEGSAFFGSFVSVLAGRKLHAPDRRSSFRSAAMRVR